MYPEITQFKSWLTCQYPTSSTSVHYTSDLVLFFSFSDKLPAEITAQDVDDFIARCQAKGHAATIKPYKPNSFANSDGVKALIGDFS